MERDEKDRRDIDVKDGTITVRTNPSGAIVTIEGISRTTPAIFDVKGRESPYDIYIKMDGYDGYTQIVVVPKGSEIRIDITLAKERY